MEQVNVNDVELEIQLIIKVDQILMKQNQLIKFITSLSLKNIGANQTTVSERVADIVTQYKLLK